MKTQRMGAAAVYAAMLLFADVVAAAPVGSAFTYQGQLKQDGVPVSDTLPMVFSLWNAESGGATVASDIEDNAVEVVNGLFSVSLDFGAGAFTGEARWLEVAVDGTTLTPRQAITPIPYALHAFEGPGGSSNWVDDGDNVFLPAGNAGIGTNEPTAMLHLNRPHAATALRFQSLRFDQGAPTSMVRGPSAAASTGQGQPWNNPEKSLSTNNDYSVVNLSEVVGTPDADQSAFLDLTSASFSIPLGGEVTGITVQVEGHATANCSDCEAAEITLSAELLGGSGPSSTRFFELGESDTVVPVGGNTDPWGLDWTPAQVNGTGFGVRLSANLAVGEIICIFGACGLIPCDCTGTGSSHIDAVTITVFYFDTPTTSSPVEWSLGASEEDANFRIAPTSDLSSPAMVIAPFGSVGIGSTDFLNGFYKLVVNGPAAKPSGGSWSSLSDARVKKNVEPLSGALSRLLSLRGVTFEFNEEGLRTGLALPGRHVGFIAQEVESVFPEWVGQAGDGYKVISEYGTTALLVESLRELRAEKDKEIAELRQRLMKLEAALRTVAGNETEEKP